MPYSKLDVHKAQSLIYIEAHFYDEYGHGVITDLSIPALELLEERIQDAKAKIRKMGGQQ
jgi:hypothetical protein